MARVCCICNKGQMTGNKVSHSNRKARRNWKPNLMKKEVLINGKVKNDYICTRCYKTANKTDM